LSKISKLNKFSKTYVIAEIGFNHLGSFNLAKKMVLLAIKSGANAVKFQIFDPIELVNKKSPHFKLIKNCDLKIEEYFKIKTICRKHKIDFLTTPFDKKSINISKKIGFDAIKVASMDLNNYQILKEVKKLNKPIILSTGMSSIKEIRNSFNFLKKSNNVFLLHCISKYPTKTEEIGLNFLNDLKKISQWKIGFSDHTTNNLAGIMSIVLGVKIIEKHFTSDNNLPGADNKLSLNPANMKKFIQEIRIAEKGLEIKFPRADEKVKEKFRRYFFARTFIKKGDKINDSNIILRRNIKYNKNQIDAGNYLDYLNKKINRDLKVNDIILKSYF
jgi:N,N'-diacetyllegionaminate synthase